MLLYRNIIIMEITRYIHVYIYIYTCNEVTVQKWRTKNGEYEYLYYSALVLSRHVLSQISL